MTSVGYREHAGSRGVCTNLIIEREHVQGSPRTLVTPATGGWVRAVGRLCGGAWCRIVLSYPDRFAESKSVSAAS